VTLPFGLGSLYPPATLILDLDAEKAVAALLRADGDSPAIATRIAVDDGVGYHLGKAQDRVSG
jgi:hypothetical protein